MTSRQRSEWKDEHVHMRISDITVTHLLLDVMRVLHHRDGLFEIEVGSVRARGKPS
jgi:hypothetical protein